MDFSKKHFFQLKSLFIILLFTLSIFILIPTPNAYAGYLDSGSGSSFVQGIVAILAFFGRMVDKIKSLFRFGKNKS